MNAEQQAKHNYWMQRLTNPYEHSWKDIATREQFRDELSAAIAQLCAKPDSAELSPVPNNDRYKHMVDLLWSIVRSDNQLSRSKNADLLGSLIRGSFQPKPGMSEPIPNHERWAIYYDSKGEHTYPPAWSDGADELYKSAEFAQARIDAFGEGGTPKHHYSPRKVYVYAAPLNIAQQAFQKPHFQEYINECFPDIAALQSQLTQLQEENAELKHVLDHMEEEVEQYKSENKTYREENARLKEAIKNAVQNGFDLGKIYGEL